MIILKHSVYMYVGYYATSGKTEMIRHAKINRDRSSKLKKAQKLLLTFQFSRSIIL